MSLIFNIQDKKKAVFLIIKCRRVTFHTALSLCSHALEWSHSQLLVNVEWHVYVVEWHVEWHQKLDFRTHEQIYSCLLIMWCNSSILFHRAMQQINVTLLTKSEVNFIKNWIMLAQSHERRHRLRLRGVFIRILWCRSAVKMAEKGDGHLKPIHGKILWLHAVFSRASV